jgi:hypothetical protein
VDARGDRASRTIAGQARQHIIIGGLAVSAHGHVRPSKDLDIVPDPAHENLARLVSALADANALDAEVSDFDQAEIPKSAMRLENLVDGGNLRLFTDLGDIEDLRRLGED